MNNKRVVCLFLILLFAFIFCAGCGETVKGMSKDAQRVGRGTKTIFVSDE